MRLVKDWSDIEKIKETAGYARICEFLRSKFIHFFAQQIFVNHLLCDGHSAGPENGGKNQRNMTLLL